MINKIRNKKKNTKETQMITLLGKKKMISFLLINDYYDKDKNT